MHKATTALDAQGAKSVNKALVEEILGDLSSGGVEQRGLSKFAFWAIGSIIKCHLASRVEEVCSRRVIMMGHVVSHILGLGRHA